MSKKSEANHRGEVTLPLDGQEYQLRPSREAIMNIERSLGRSLFELTDAARSHSLSIEEMAAITAEMMRAYARSHPDDPLLSSYQGAKPERLAELIFEAGPMMIQPRITVVLLSALTGGVDASGEAKPKAGSR